MQPAGYSTISLLPQILGHIFLLMKPMVKPFRSDAVIDIIYMANSIFVDCHCSDELFNIHLINYRCIFLAFTSTKFGIGQLPI